jgi:hypothetical protein
VHPLHREGKHHLGSGEKMKKISTKSELEIYVPRLHSDICIHER